MENTMAIFYCFVIVCYQKWHWNEGIISYDCVHNLFFPEGVRTLTHQYGFTITMCVAIINYLHSNFHFKKLYSHSSVHFGLTRVFMILLQLNRTRLEGEMACQRPYRKSTDAEIQISRVLIQSSFHKAILEKKMSEPHQEVEEMIFFNFSYWLAVLSPTPSPNDLEMLN